MWLKAVDERVQECRRSEALRSNRPDRAAIHAGAAVTLLALVQDVTRPVLSVVSAAVSKDGTVYTLPRPARHHDVIRHMHEQGVSRGHSDQGFVLNDGRFVMRKPALRVAEEAGQILEGAKLRRVHGLFSEDVW